MRCVCVLGDLNILLQATNNLEAYVSQASWPKPLCKKCETTWTLQVYSIKFTSLYVAYRQIVKTLCRKILHLLSGLYCTNIVMELPHCRKTLAASWYVALRILIPQTSRSWSPTWIFQNIFFCKCGLTMLESMWRCVVGWNISQIHKLTEHDILNMLANLAIHRCSKTTVCHNLLTFWRLTSTIVVVLHC